MHLVRCLRASAMAYSATTVLPADVCAATNTHSCFSRCKIARFWNVSSSNGNLNAMSGTRKWKLLTGTLVSSITAHSLDWSSTGVLAGAFAAPASRAYDEIFSTESSSPSAACHVSDANSFVVIIQTGPSASGAVFFTSAGGGTARDRVAPAIQRSNKRSGGLVSMAAACSMLMNPSTMF